MTLPRSRRQEVAAALVAVLIARTALNGGLRVVYPFLPAIARGLGVSFAALATLVAVRSLLGLAAPLAARAAERVGRRALMFTAMLTAAVSCLLVAGSRGVVVAGAGFLLIGLAKPAFDIPMQAWFGERVPYRRRGRVLGITELTWALSLLVTVPVSGVLIDRVGWQAPFLLVALLCVAGAAVVARLITPDRPAVHVPRPLRLTGPRLRILGVVLLFSLGAESLFVVYGSWLERDLGLSVVAIGTFTLVVVVAELSGEAAVALFADRLGLRRSILLGLVLTAAAYLSVGLVGGSVVVAIAVVVVWFVGFEVTIVSTIPFVSELAIESRDRLLSLMAGVVAVGRAVGAVVAPRLFAAGGIALTGRVAAGCVAAAVLLLLAVPSPTPGLRPGSSPG